MIVDIGGGSTEAAIISLGGVVVHKSARVAGNKVDEAIAQYIKKRHNLVIGERMAEMIKITLADAMPAQPKKPASTNLMRGVKPDSIAPKPQEQVRADTMEVRGRDALTGLPRLIELTRIEVHEAIRPVLLQMVAAVKSALEQTPPELAADIIDKGIVMAGGTSLLCNLDALFTRETGVVCHVADDPMLCVVRGTGVAIENIALYKRSISKK
jgi:rod shape-determining protein MreB